MTSGKARMDGRKNDELRPIRLEVDFTKWAEGSVLAAYGDTRVLCTASVEDRAPPWLKEQQQGWVTAEYSMLPRATETRSAREAVRGKIGGRTHEISRLIGRSLRAGVDLKALHDRTITIDCDVLQADGGTRTASITGGFVALALACRRLFKSGALRRDPIRRFVAAVSLGVVGDEVLLDLDFHEDRDADADVNLVMTADGGIVELQGTAEGAPFSKAHLDRLLEMGRVGIDTLVQAQRTALGL
ncbi:MAG: ribonuclease PH [Deltaproteobacteria bacterium]|nr:ribonuclease PH [Deltaproteobacteria bacterium]